MHSIVLTVLYKNAEKGAVYPLYSLCTTILSLEASVTATSLSPVSNKAPRLPGWNRESRLENNLSDKELKGDMGAVDCRQEREQKQTD